ncbi:unnamed protein product, partial [marine sediment metagenome]
MLCGWFGLVTIIPWPVALIWAYMDPPDTAMQPELLSHDDITRIAISLRRTSDRVAKIEQSLSENASDPRLK